MTVIKVSDNDAAALTAKAARLGLTLEGWIKKMAEDDAENELEPSAARPLQTAADIVLSRMRKVPAEIMASMPKDGASQHDHYIYGWPKKEA